MGLLYVLIADKRELISEGALVKIPGSLCSSVSSAILLPGALSSMGGPLFPWTQSLRGAREKQLLFAR